MSSLILSPFLVGAEVVHDHDLTAPQTRGEHSLDVGLKHFAIGDALHSKSWPHPLHAHAGKQGGVLPSVTGHQAVRPLPAARPSMRDRKGSVERGVFAPISSTKTNRCGSELFETVTHQTALRHSSRSVAPTARFFG